jgi:hypothetical protein
LILKQNRLLVVVFHDFDIQDFPVCLFFKVDWTVAQPFGGEEQLYKNTAPIRRVSLESIPKGLFSHP